MAFKVAWKGVSVQQGKLVNLTGEEIVDGQSAIEAVHNARNAIMSKLQTGDGYALTNINIKNQEGPTTVSLKEVYTFIGSVNAEGNLAKGAMNIPTSFKITQSPSPELHWQGRSVGPDDTEHVVTGKQTIKPGPLLEVLKSTRAAIVMDLQKSDGRFVIDHFIVKNMTVSCKSDDVYDFIADLNNEGGLEVTAEEGPKWVTFDSRTVKGQTKIFLPK